MDVRDLKAFVTLARTLHFARAAEELHVSQPALTKQLRHIEARLGGKLFERGPSGSRLTRLGEQLLGEARRCLESFLAFEERARRLAQGASGQLHVGFGFHTLELVPRLLIGVRGSMPALETSLQDMSTREQMEALQSRQIDVGFMRWPPVGEWDSLPVAEDQVVLVSRLEEPVLDLGACRNLPFLMIAEARSPTLYGHCLRLCAEHGFSPRVVQQVPEVTTALALVRAGMGVSMLPGSFVTMQEHLVHCTILPTPSARWQVGAVWRPGDENPALRKFLDLLALELGIKPA